MSLYNVTLSWEQSRLSINQIYLAVSGSNEFAESGENPIWQAAMENTEYDENELQFMDDVSEYSGDSILIGVEDQTEFNDYSEKMREIEVDMDLYSKLQGNRSTCP